MKLGVNSIVSPTALNYSNNSTKLKKLKKKGNNNNTVNMV